MTINILGTPYEIIVKKYDEDENFERDMNTYEGWENDDEETKINCHKTNLRHEITHAFFYESGLWDNTNRQVGAWAKNEELIDWIALQGVKIFNAWKEADAI